jgi:hypothetical protein
MNLTEHAIAHVCSGLVIAGLLGLCLRSPAASAVAADRRAYRAHPAWYVFCAAGGVLLVGIFAFASRTALPETKTIAAWGSAGTAIFFVGTVLILRAAQVTLDERDLTSRTMFGERTVALDQVETVAINGLSVEVRLREDPATRRRPRTVAFFAGLRGLGDLVATIQGRSRAGG